MNRTAFASVWPPDARAIAEAGHKPMSPIEAIRRKCLDCSCYQPSEVKLCQALACPLWPFRAGRHPYTKRRLQEPCFDEPPSEATKMARARPSAEMSAQGASFAERRPIPG